MKVLLVNSPSRKEPSEWVISPAPASIVSVPLVKFKELTCGRTTRTVPLSPWRGVPLAAWLCPPVALMLALVALPLLMKEDVPSMKTRPPPPPAAPSPPPSVACVLPPALIHGTDGPPLAATLTPLFTTTWFALR